MITRRALAVLMVSVAVAVLGVGFAATTTFAAAECTYDGPRITRVCVTTDVTHVVVSASAGVATNTFATGADEAVFWSGIGRGGDATAASWAAKTSGATLESTMAQRGNQLPAWDASNPSVVAAWRQASTDFASGASGNVRVLQGADVRVGGVWAQVE